MAKPTLALIPSAIGDKLYSVLPSDGSGDFDFTRATTATRVNKDGLIETVASGDARLNYPMIDGKVSGCPSHLLEPSRSNLVTYSQEVSNWSIISSGIVITDNTTDILSPSGNNDASKVEFNAASKILGQSPTLSGNYSGFIYVKGTQGETIRFNFGGTEENFTLTGGWDKLERTNITATANAFNLNTFVGVTARTIYLWGAQIEQGSYPTSYIPTNGSAATRSVETATNSGDASTFNDSEGVLMAEIDVVADSTEKWISISDGSTTNRIILYISSSNTLRTFVGASGTQVDMNEAVNLDSYNKISFKYKQNDFALWVNGFEIETDTNGNTPSGLNVLNLSTSNGLSNHFTGSLKQLQYYDTALTDAELEYMTSYRSLNELVTELNLNEL